MRIAWMLVFAAVAILAASCFSGSGESGDGPCEPKRVGILRCEEARDFTASDADGREARLSDFVGEKPAFLNFWASWCPPCREEMPSMERVWQVRKQELTMLALAIPMRDETEDKARAFFFDEHSFSYTFLFDRTGDVMEDYRIFNIPMTYLLYENGVIAAVIVGARDWESDGCSRLLDAVVAYEKVDEDLINGCSAGFS